ncbi:MAG TPA: DUF6125 family protein [Syntrophomonadaceae bacterium]|nr:DUF6125 family protein [Syntrophomonadaceae bacterium]
MTAECNNSKTARSGDYSCKSTELVEYSCFIRSIDSWINTEYIGCPPYDYPENDSWRFAFAREGMRTLATELYQKYT